MPPLLNPLPFVFIFATAFGVMMHDTKVDKAASVAIVTPITATSNYAVEDVSKSSDHIHVERVSVTGGSATHHENVPKTQPRNDHNKYLQVKKLATSGGGNGLWPSV